MQSDFKKVAEDLKGAVDEVLAKFTEVEQLRVNPELALVKTHLLEARARVEQELSKYNQPEEGTPVAQPSRPTIVAQSANVPVTRPIDPNTPTAPEAQQQQVDDNSNLPSTASESTETTVQGDEEVTTNPTTDTETGTPTQSPEEAQPTTAPDAGTTGSSPADQPETPVTQTESISTDTTLDGQVAANTPSGQVSQEQADEATATA